MYDNANLFAIRSAGLQALNVHLYSVTYTPARRRLYQVLINF